MPTPKQALILQHVPFEGAGSIEPWLNRHHYQSQICHLYRGDPLPKVESLSLLIIMGGPMSVNDEEFYPWLVAEKSAIATAISLQIPTVGICLGAQLMANALGAAVYPNPEKEIGWFKVTAPPSRLPLPRQFNAFHWHGETFDLPPNSQRLASSALCRHQAFLIGDYALGLQFHIEITPESVQALITHCGDELTEAPSAPAIQTAKEMLAAPPSHYVALNQMMDQLLSALTHQRSCG
ncbi:amidotransferase [Ectothiorhodospiraceae bacterium BW-2]|nr:amidotransferase [Ectothiorhodospiraceae bacterium BW-2]